MSTLTLDITLESGNASAQLHDSTGAPSGTATTLSVSPARVVIADGQSLIIAGNGTDVFRVLLVHSGTSDSPQIEVTSDQGKYHLRPAPASRLGNSVILETAAEVTVAPLVVPAPVT